MSRFLRFSIRDLLWLTLLVAIGLGWFVRERQLRSDVLDWQNRCETTVNFLDAVRKEKAEWEAKALDALDRELKGESLKRERRSKLQP